MSQMRRWMSWHQPATLTPAGLERLRAAARHDGQMRLVHLFADVEAGRLMCVSEAACREDVQAWFAARELAPLELAQVHWAGDHASVHEIALYDYLAPGDA